MVIHRSLLAVISLLFWISCKNVSPGFFTLTGETMGTTYTVKLQHSSPEKIKKSLDSLLVLINQSLSTYISESTISRINKADSVFCYNSSDDVYFKTVFEKSREIYRLTDGYFDPSIAPLVNYYGFGYEQKKPLEKSDSLVVSRLLGLLLFEDVVISENANDICVVKPEPEVALDFSALAKGYGVDILAEFLNDQGIRNYMIEIGGEIRTLGVNDRGSPWIIGINRPDETSSLTAVEVPLKVSNKAMATSGNYRNSYESRGQKFAHIIHPKTGLSQETDILSVTVLAEDCMTADALATAFMVMGLDKSLELAGNLKDIDAFFIFDLEGDGQFEYRSTEHFSRYFLDN